MSTTLADVIGLGESGPLWSETTDDLNANLVVLRDGKRIAPHVNNEVDVLIVGLSGIGTLTIDGEAVPLCAGSVAIALKGSERSITPTEYPLAYVTCHKKRAGLWPKTAS